MHPEKSGLSSVPRKADTVGEHRVLEGLNLSSPENSHPEKNPNCCVFRAGLIQSVSIVYREDLDLKNHLAGHQRKLLKVAFHHTQALMEVRGELMPTIARNRANAKRCDAYSVLSSLSSSSSSAAVRLCPLLCVLACNRWSLLLC